MPDRLIVNTARHYGKSTAQNILVMPKERAEYLKNWQDAINQAVDNAAKRMSDLIDEDLYSDLCTKNAQRRKSILLLVEGVF